jgi:hypothetical protein
MRPGVVDNSSNANDTGHGAAAGEYGYGAEFGRHSQVGKYWQ